MRSWTGIGEELARLLWADVVGGAADDPAIAALADRQGKARHFRRHPGAGCQAARRPRPAGAISSWRATGPPPACPPPWKARCGRARRRRVWRSQRAGYRVGVMNQLAPADFADVESAIRAATDALLAEQRPDGHWVYELEADCHHSGGICAAGALSGRDRRIRSWSARSASICAASRATMAAGRSITKARSTSRATVKAYFALKMIGDDIDAPHMVRAREAILARGGADQGQCLHPHPAGALWRDRLERCADRAGGTDPAAALVSHPSLQDELLGPHGDRAAAGACRLGPWRAIRAGCMCPNCSCPACRRPARARRIRAPAGRPSSPRWTGV